MSDLTDKLRALADEIDAAADEDEQHLNSAHVSVSEAHELPVAIRLGRAHARELRAILDAERDETADLCGLCKRPATGLASINGTRYCHGDEDATPTCYEVVGWRESGDHRDLYTVYDAPSVSPGEPEGQPEGSERLTPCGSRACTGCHICVAAVAPAPVPDDEAAEALVDRMALAAFRVRYGREPVPESFDQSRLSDLHSRMEGAAPVVAEHTQALQAEVERYRRIVTDAALETYTPDGSEIVVAQIHEYARRAEAAEGEVRRLRTGIEALVVEIERPYEASPRRRRGWVDRLRGLLDGGH